MYIISTTKRSGRGTSPIVLTEQKYARLSKNAAPSGLFALLDKKASGTRSRKEIDRQLSQERDAWK